MFVTVLEYILWSCVGYILTFGAGDQILAWYARRHRADRDQTTPPDKEREEK